MDYLLREVVLSWKLAKMAEGERDIVIQKLRMANGQLEVERVRADLVEASVVVMSIYFDMSIVECAELRHLLTEV